MDLVWIILIIVNVLLYGLCCFVILKRKTFTCISIRSPRLLILNIIGNLLMTIIIMVTVSLENSGRKICSLFYYITNFLIIIPLCLRFSRIAKCCEVNNDLTLEIQGTNLKKAKYQEKYYIRLMLIIFVALTAILLIANAIISISDPITPKFLYIIDADSKLDTANSIIWLMVNFIEHILILTFVFKICNNKIKQKLRFEIISTFAIWFIYSNLIGLLEVAKVTIDYNIFIYISLVVCYLFLIINAIILILMSYGYKNSTIYSYPPRLMNNLYLFLSNEICYTHFKNYLIEHNANASMLLQLYADIMGYKLGFKLKDGTNDELEEAQLIRNEYFRTNNIAHLPEKTLENVKNKCAQLDNNHYGEDIFDEALNYCYTELGTSFEEYKKSDEFKTLYKENFLTTYIQCKMILVGLINKF